MIEISLQNITIPIPRPWRKNKPEQQRENFFYVVLQILQEMKAGGFVLSFDETKTTPLDGINDTNEAIRDLLYNGQEIDIGDVLKIILHGKTMSVESP